MDSILTSIKKLLGIEKEYEHFDPDIIMHINSVFTDLTQIGVGPAEGFIIEDDTSVWEEFIGNQIISIESVKTYTYLRVKLVFDPPLSSAVIASMERQIEKLEWRINVAVETGEMVADDIKLDYTKLDNLPTLNGTPIIGNVDEKDPTVAGMPSSDIDSLWNKKFNT